MSNTIKLKRGSGSDPTASDLVAGEVALRTDTGKLFTKKDNGNVAEIGGSGISDGDKGDITVSNSGDTFTIDSGVIDNANIASNAAIAGSKISPSFTSNITISTTVPTITFTDTDNNPDFTIKNDNGGLRFRDETNSASRLLINSDGHVDIFGNLDVNAGIDVTGNITVSGTVDGVDIAARNTLFGGLTSSSGVLTNGVTATTQSASDNSTKIATTAYTDTAIANLVDSAPGTLNTLNELAAALGDDPNFATTVTNSIATKMPLAGGTFTGDVTFQSNSGNIIFDKSDNALEFSDNNKAKFGGSGDLQIFHDGSENVINCANSHNLEIRNGSERLAEFGPNGAVDLYFDNNKKFATATSGVSITGNIAVSGTVDGRDVASDGSKLDGIESGATADQSNSEIKTAYEANSNTNAFTDALLSKLNGIAASATNVTNNNQLTNGAGYITATLTNEQVQDIVGGMVSGNTESGITVTYQDGDGTLDFSVASQTDQNFTTTLKNKLDGIAAGATNVTNNNQLTNGAGYVTSSGNTIIGTDSDINTSGATVIDQLNMTDGVITSHSTRTLTLANLGYTGATNANNITNNNQLTNGAGYITSASFSDVAGGGTFTGDISVSGGAAALNVNANSDIRFTNGTWTGNACKIQHHNNSLYISGGSSGIIFRESGTDRAKIDGSGHFLPGADNTYRLGSPSVRWQDVYTNDLNLSNEGSSNKVDNTWGDYTIQEGADDLFIINNRNGKMFKFMLQEVK